MQYLNFDIYIGDKGSDGFPLRVECRGHLTWPGMGEQRGSLLLDPENPKFRARLERLDERKTDRDFLRELGETLYQQLFNGDIEKLLFKSLGAAEAQPELGVRLRLRIDDPSIAALPWELVYTSSEQGFLCTQINSPIVRYQEMARVIPELSTKLPLNMLVVIPHYSARFEAVDGKRERRVIEKALDKMRDQVNIDFLEGASASWAGLHEQLTEGGQGGAYHCVHFIGHGSFQNGRGHLVLSGEDNQDDIVSDERFAELFRNIPSIKLVVLNACQGATSSSSQALSGTAAQLVSSGVPAVVAMQFSILDKAAVEFARTFYRNLFRGTNSGRVDVAISHARHILRTSFPDQREMVTPILVTHASDGTLFVPEKDGFWGDIRRHGTLNTANTQQSHALGLLQDLKREDPENQELAAQISGIVSELATFRRRIRQARVAALTALAVGLLVFVLFWTSVLDIFTLDTRAESTIMALGDRFAEPGFSELIETVGFRFKDRTLAENRSAVATVIRNLGAANSRLIVLDINYPTSNGDFASEPQAGAKIVDAIRGLGPQTDVVLGARSAKAGQMIAPDQLLQAAAGIGHACVESKLGIARSLPISIVRDSRHTPSLALAAMAAFEGAVVDPVTAATIEFPEAPNAPKRRFAASEKNTVIDPSAVCEPAVAGATVTHRFFRLRSHELATSLLIDSSEISAIDPTDQGAMQDLRERYSGKIVILGVVDSGDIVRDRSGQRLGLLWQADALNSLLNDVHLRPMATGAQFILMLCLAGVAAALALIVHKGKYISLAVLLMLSATLLLAAVYTYAHHNILFNPLYHIIAVWLAWWATRRFGVMWLTR